MSSKNKHEKTTKKVLDWEYYEQGSDELYSYLKKKGKHQRGEKNTKDR